MTARVKPVQPMLASEVNLDRLERLEWPLWASAKLDGIRAIVKDGVVVSRTLKLIPSQFVQRMWGRPEFEGFDGELICGDPTDKNVYQKTFSAVMTHGSMEPVEFYVFDRWVNSELSFELRHERLCDILVETGVENNKIVLVHQEEVRNWRQVETFESLILNEGYEGLMIRNPTCGYKFGRSTFLEQALLKLKRFKDSEAVVTGAEELLRNNNEPLLDSRGLTVRSTHIANKLGAGTLGALVVRDVVTGLEFRIGTGLDMATRDQLWARHLNGTLLGQLVKYKYLDYGVVELPRHPVFLGLRSKEDM
jgi:DNA ligase 1